MTHLSRVLSSGRVEPWSSSTLEIARSRFVCIEYEFEAAECSNEWNSGQELIPATGIRRHRFLFRALRLILVYRVAGDCSKSETVFRKYENWGRRHTSGLLAVHLNASR